MSVSIDNRTARRTIMALQGLSQRPDRPLRGDALAAAIADLGFVQVDSVSTVARAHHHILFSRSQSFRPGQLAHLIERRRVLFENWTHDASIIPSAFFPYWRHRFEREKLRLRKRWKFVFGHEGFEQDLARIREHVARTGPVMAREFESEKAGTGWWDWHPSKSALEYLWRTGELAICRRRGGFQKVYDLTERVIPDMHFQRMADHDAFVDWACREALKRLGFGTRGEIAAFWAHLTPNEVQDWIAGNRAELVDCRVESADGSLRPSLMLPETLDRLSGIPAPPERLRIMSPFDPLLRDRARTHRLFDFHYRIEIFVPEPRRKYGYYVFPVLRGDRLVGRIDMKAMREKDALEVEAFWPEPGRRVGKMLVGALEAELERMRRFTGVGSVIFRDGWLREPLAGG